MKIEELRVGSVVVGDYPKPNTICKVIAYSFIIDRVNLLKIGAQIKNRHFLSIDNIRPLILDGDTLKRTGMFVEMGTNGRQFSTFIQQETSKHLELNKWSDEWRVVMQNHHICNVKYFHELQDVFRVLSGEYLDYK